MISVAEATSTTTAIEAVDASSAVDVLSGEMDTKALLDAALPTAPPPEFGIFTIAHISIHHVCGCVRRCRCVSSLYPP